MDSLEGVLGIRVSSSISWGLSLHGKHHRRDETPDAQGPFKQTHLYVSHNLNCLKGLYKGCLWGILRGY